MRGAARVLLAIWMSGTCAGYARLDAARPQAPPSTPASPRAVVDRYCTACHNGTRRAGGLALDTIDIVNVADAGEVWERVVRQLRGGSMPPPGTARPDKPAADALASYLEAALDRAAAVRPNPGRPPALHRLNRVEYHNAIRDLLSIDVDVAELLPPDDGSYGFDNIAGVLKVSPTLLERYLSAAQKVGRLAVGAPVAAPAAETFRVQSELPQADRLDGLPFGTRGGTLVTYDFPVDADYTIKLELARIGETVLGLSDADDIEISIDGVRAKLFTVGDARPRRAGAPSGPARPKADETNEPSTRYQDTQFENVRPYKPQEPADAHLSVRVAVKAGPKKVGVAFIKKSSAQADDLRQPFLRPGVERGDTGGQPYLASVTIAGPFDPLGVSDTPSRRRVFVCRPTGDGDEPRCAKRILATLARRAYRRPVTDADLEALVPFYDEGRADGGFDAGIELALERLLVGPEFLFRIERDPAGLAPGAVYRVSDRDLASRLSFFLWSSIPDEELLDAAEHRRLSDPATLERQVRRMLADPRSDALVENFAAQWLHVRNVAGVVPNQRQFPDFDESLRQAFRRETELFIGSVLREDRSVVDLLRANYTFVNERLARHYGIPNVYGSRFRRVTLDDPARAGLLGQGSILTVTSYANRTSPVLRGKWILENILGTPPPPPPPNVPALVDTNAKGQLLSMRDRMAQHRASPVCAGCHARMDPLGLALENFDAVGRWRARGESNAAIDASGVLPDGTRFEGAPGLRQALVARSDRFVATAVEKLLTYALGRGLESYDAPAVRRIARAARADDDRLSSLVVGVVTSAPFEMRRSLEPSPEAPRATPR